MPGRFSVSWGDPQATSGPGPGTYAIARLTFPQGVFPSVHPLSYVSQTNPNSTVNIIDLAPGGPAIANWVTDADGEWHVGSNWSTGTPPTGEYVVQIDVGGANVRTITHSQGSTEVRRIASQEHIRLAGGTLWAIEQGISVANGLTIDGGTLRGAVSGSPVTVGPNGGRAEGTDLRGGLILPGGAPLVVRHGLFLTGNASFSPGASLRFENSQVLDGSVAQGTGVLHFQGGGRITIDGGATLTILQPITLRGHGGVIGVRTAGTVDAARINLYGTINADVAGGSLVIDGDAMLSHGTLTAGAGALLQINPSLTAHVGTVGGDGAVRALGGLHVSFDIDKSGDGPLRVNGELLLPVGNTIDLLGGGLIHDYVGDSSLATLRDRVIRGYNNGSWNGSGIRSSTAAANDDLAVGYAEASALFASFPASFFGESIDDTTLLVRLVRNGDSNLDGTINLADFNRLASSFGSTNALWDDGDFNYDGNVNLSDFNLLAANYGLGAAGPDVAPEEWSALASAVPEPGVLGLGLLAFLNARRHRRG